MQLTTELATRYVGGQIEIQNRTEEYLYRGTISSIVVSDDTLKVELLWMAEGVGYPPLPEKWLNHENLTYEASLLIYSVSDIGDGRISLSSPITGELVVLYPPDGSKLDPSVVEGLDLRLVNPTVTSA